MKNVIISFGFLIASVLASACGASASQGSNPSSDSVQTLMVNQVSALGGVQLVDYTGADTSAVVAAVPFPQNRSFAGVIRPDHKSVEALNQDVITFYEQWKASYLRNYPGTAMLYINGDLTGGLPESWPKDVRGASTSEATGYGMLVFALMAGHDPQAKSYFDGLLEMYLNNQASTKDGSHAPLMSWVVPSRFDLSLERVDGAADGDLDIGYALLLADKQWGSDTGADGAVVKSVKIDEGGKTIFGRERSDYLGLAKRQINGILKYLVSEKSNRILMGDWQSGMDGGIGKGAENRQNASSTRPSDWMVDHLRAFDKAVPNPRWQDAIDEIYRIAPIVTGPNTGLFPDFVEDVNGVPSKVVKDLPYKNPKGKDALMYLESEFDDAYNWNACRVPWRIGTDLAHHNSPQARELLMKINEWATANIGTGPNDYADSIWHGYTLDGEKIMEEGDWGNSLAFTAPLVTALIVDSRFQPHLNHGWDYLAENFLGDHTEEGYSGYFSDSIGLLNLLLISGNWWNPAE